MNRLIYAVISILPVLFFIAACSSDSSNSQESGGIPEGFTTYSMEGYFEISYPSDWKPAQSILDELWADTLDDLGTEGLEETELIFLAGMALGDGSYYPTVNIAIDALAAGYRTLDEVVEAYDIYEQQNPTQGFQEYARTEKTVNGRKVVITDTKDDEPGYDPWRYLQLVTVGDEYAWIVTCACESDDYPEYRDDFEKVLNSFQVRR